MQRPLFATCRLGLLWALLAGCKENLSAPTPGGGPDVEGPEVSFVPAQDTLVDSTGVLSIVVRVVDRSRIAEISLRLVGTPFAFAPIAPESTVALIVYLIALEPQRGSRFSYSVRAVDVLNHETVTDTVTVTVK